MTRKPSALKVIWNKDLSLSVYLASGGPLLIKRKMYPDETWLDTVAPFCEGWFETADRNQWKIRCDVRK
jgi:hypothetical protein